MITEILRDRIVKASLEVSNARDSIRHVLQTIAGNTNKPATNSTAGAPVDPHHIPLSRAIDLLEAEIIGLHRELREFRGDEPEEATMGIAVPGRYK